MTAFAPLEIAPGTDVRGFLTERRLGAGGFGTVYRARRGERLYALKFIHRSRAGGWAKREVEMLLRVSHPNVVGFEGCGFWPDDTREYLVVFMDYVEGRHLGAWAQEENPDARAVAQKVFGVGRALVELHRLQVFHRDLKEVNILIRASDGEPVLVDLGVAGGANTVRVTRDVLPPCTLEYRSPEAWRFLQENAHRLDIHYAPGPADDLYALGVVLYWLLTGRWPCVGATEAGQAEATLHHVPEPPHVINPRVPEALSAICMKLLEKQPENRYPDAEALCAAVERVLAGADAAWSVPLCDFHARDNATTEGSEARANGDGGVEHWLREAWLARERPRRGRRPVQAAPALPAPPLEPPVVEPPGRAEPEAGPPSSASSSSGARPLRAAALRWPRWGAAALGLVLLLGLAVVMSPPRSATSLEPRARPFAAVPETLRETTWEVGEAGWKVAPPWKPPEATRRDFVVTEAAALVAAPALHEKGETSVKNPQQKRQKGLGPVGKAIGTGAACLTLACTGPQVRSTPPPEECPPGAVEAMAELDIDIGDRNDVVLPSGPGGEVVSVSEGWTRVRLVGAFEDLRPNTLLKGRLLFGGERVYGRFTEAQEYDGPRTWPVCMELWDEDERGLMLEPGSTADTAKVFNAPEVKAVDRFK